MERYEYKVLVTRGDVRIGWFDGEERLGSRHDLEEILNRYAANGWRLVAHAMGAALSRVILERPHQPPEVLPALEPAGRGDELAPALASGGRAALAAGR